MHFHQLFAVGSGLLALFFSSASQAAPHARDGFYLQLATGIGAPQFSSTAHNPYFNPALDYADHRSGPSLNGSLFLGVPLAPGLALGVGGLVAAVWSSAPDRTENGQRVTWEDGGGPYIQTLAAAGPFVDYYPSARFGWHVQALVGYATLGQGDVNTSAPGGVGLMAGVGQDWWISERWSVGFLARVLYASTRLSTVPDPDGIGGAPSEHDTLISPSLEVSFTFH
jgi:hypothetical protein